MAFLATLLVTAAAAALVTALLVNIFHRKQEARNPYLKLVNVTEDTTDPAPWGMNWPREYDQYQAHGRSIAHQLRRRRRARPA